ncbi:UNVERIFIED_CONTAM: hypothetical protein FKN15_040086 [Acipenser sinensis]
MVLHYLGAAMAGLPPSPVSSREALLLRGRREGEATLSPAREGEAPLSPEREGKAPLSPAQEREGPLSPEQKGEGPLSPEREGEAPLSPDSQVAGQPGTVACLVPCSTPPGFPDIAAQEEDITAQWADVADAPPAGCFVPSSYCSAPPGIPDVAAPVHSHTPLPASLCSRSPAGAVVALDMPSGSLLAGPGSLPGNAGGTDPPSSPPVEKGEN